MTEATSTTRRRSSHQPHHIQIQEPRIGEARVNNVRLTYHEWDGPSPASYPPAVLLHGVLQTKEGMANLAAHLSRRGRVVVPDLRGRGDSEQPEDGYDPATLAGDVAGLIVTLGLDRPVLIGRLHGGLIAYHLAASHPDLVRGLVIGDTPPEVDEQRAARILATVRGFPRRFASRDDALAYYQDRLGLSEARAQHDLPHDLIPEEHGGYRWRHNLSVIERLEQASLPRSDWHLLGKIACPTLVLRGQRGEISKETAVRLKETIGRCQVQTVLGARHDVFLGAGCEQSFGAIHLFLRGLKDAIPRDQPNVAAANSGPAARRMIERIVAAINSRDAMAVEAAFASDGRIVQYRPEGKVRDGGLDAARQAFEEIFVDLPGGVVEARDIVATDDHAACVLIVRDPVPTADDTATIVLAPLFVRVRGEQIVELTSYGLRLPVEAL